MKFSLSVFYLSFLVGSNAAILNANPTLLTEEEISRCHAPVSRRTMRDCHAYVTSNLNTDHYPSLPDECTSVTWKESWEALGSGEQG